MTDTDPPNEVGDIPCPINGFVQAPSTNTLAQQVHNAAHAIQGDKCRNGNKHVPPPWRFRLNRAYDILRNIVVGLVT